MFSPDGKQICDVFVSFLTGSASIYVEIATPVSTNATSAILLALKSASSGVVPNTVFPIFPSGNNTT